VIGQNVLMYDHDHDYHSLETLHHDFIEGEITIGNNVWIGSNVVILRDRCGCIVKEKIEPGLLVYPAQLKLMKK
jgi:UDP-3-O-[3-hydroxymyristoyl] glucosamine N-acyltransferase